MYKREFYNRTEVQNVSHSQLYLDSLTLEMTLTLGTKTVKISNTKQTFDKKIILFRFQLILKQIQSVDFLYFTINWINLH